MSSAPSAGTRQPPRGYLVMKRTLDVIVASVGLIILSPVLITTALLVSLHLGRPVIFAQTRPGLNGRPFTLLKFRSMVNSTDEQGRLLPDADRLTRFGAFLRRTSLDELPELWNVLRGDMSLVGPRPLLIRYTPYLTKVERGRLCVRPGVTGWAQVNGRNMATWDERLALDIWYVRQRNLKLDMQILAMTFSRVFRSAGVHADPGSHMLDLDQERKLNAPRDDV